MIQESEKPILRVLVKLEGGLVQWVGTSCDTHHIQVAVIDYDTEGASADEIIEIPQDGGSVADAVARIDQADLDPEFVNNAFQAIEDA